MKHRRTPILNKVDIASHFKIENVSKPAYNDSANTSEAKKLEPSRNHSMVILSSNGNEKSQNLSKSRPKQRQIKLVDEEPHSILKLLEKNHNRIEQPANQESGNSHIPKILASSEEPDAFTERSKSKGMRNNLSVERSEHSSAGKLSNLHTPSIHKSKVAIEKPKNVEPLTRKKSLQKREKGLISILPSHLSMLEKYPGDTSKVSCISLPV